MNADLEVAYLGVEVADPTAFGEFLANIAGLVPGTPTSDGAAAWRNDERVHRLLVKGGPANDAAFDRAWNAGLPIANVLGKHDNDKMFSFYVVTPAGFQLEFGYGARTIDDPWTDDRRYDRISEWGHQPIASPLHQS